jgi:hypothetical protein
MFVAGVNSSGPPFRLELGEFDAKSWAAIAIKI